VKPIFFFSKSFAFPGKMFAFPHETLLDKLYYLYGQSPKNLRELDEAASVVGTQLRK